MVIKSQQTLSHPRDFFFFFTHKMFLHVFYIFVYCFLNQPLSQQFPDLSLCFRGFAPTTYLCNIFEHIPSLWGTEGVETGSVLGRELDQNSVTAPLKTQCFTRLLMHNTPWCSTSEVSKAWNVPGRSFSINFIFLFTIFLFLSIKIFPEFLCETEKSQSTFSLHRPARRGHQSPNQRSVIRRP